MIICDFGISSHISFARIREIPIGLALGTQIIAEVECICIWICIFNREKKLHSRFSKYSVNYSLNYDLSHLPLFMFYSPWPWLSFSVGRWNHINQKENRTKTLEYVYSIFPEIILSAVPVHQVPLDLLNRRIIGSFESIWRNLSSDVANEFMCSFRCAFPFNSFVTISRLWILDSFFISFARITHSRRWRL